MKMLKALGLVLLGAVMMLCLFLYAAIDQEVNDDFHAAQYALKDTGLTAYASLPLRALTMDTHGGFHGDGCCHTIFTLGRSDRDALWAALQTTPGWQVKSVSLQDYADNLGHGYCACQSAVYPAPDTVFDACFYRDDNPGGTYSFNFTTAYYDRETGMLFYYRLDT